MGCGLLYFPSSGGLGLPIQIHNQARCFGSPPLLFVNEAAEKEENASKD